tara:strand:+ start:621 stop:947 length:327 start_codon:yes stop_codon:yes gene_type:complete
MVLEQAKQLWEKVEKYEFTGPGLLKKARENEGNGKTIEGFGGGVVIAQIFFLIISLYAQYIIVKCYCGDYLYVLLMTACVGCCPLCTVPYLYYNHFVNGCGKGQIGKP